MQYGDNLLELIEQFFKNTNICIDRRTTNTEFLRLVDTVTSVRININWDDAFLFLENKDYRFQDLEINSHHDLYMEGIFREISRLQLYSMSNKKFKLWADNINCFTGRITQGFSKESEKYAEFIIEINNEYLRDLDIYFNDISNSLIYNFNIEKIDIEISNPSDMFKLIFLQNSLLGLKGGWEDVITLKMRNLKKSEIESIIQQSLFLINSKLFEPFIFGLNKNGSDQPNFKYASINTNKEFYPKAKYFEPISYYNVAIYAPNEMRFLYYYKVLEFFFKKKELLPNDSRLHKKEKIYDRALIKLFLQSPFIENNVIEIAEQDFFQDTLVKKNKNQSDTSKNIIDLFGDELYNYRNKVAHGGSSSRRLPAFTEANYPEDSNSMEWWNITIKELTEVCINHFCYNDIQIKHIN